MFIMFITKTIMYMVSVETQDLVALVNNFHNARVLVIGDLVLDKFIRGSINRISDEAPVPVLDFTSEIVRPGGAANAMSNIRSLGGDVIAVGMVGDDPEGLMLKKILSDSEVNTAGILVCQEHQTIVKTRIIAEKNQQNVFRIDRDYKRDADPAETEAMLGFIRKAIGNIGAILISDYDYGVVTTHLLDELIPLAKERHVPIIVDSKVEHFLNYNNVKLIKVSLQVAGQVTGVSPVNETSIRNIGQWMLTQLEPEYLLITRGKDGMSLFERNGQVINIPSVAEDIKEVTGVADTVAAVIALSIATEQQKIVESAVLANTSAGLKTGKLGQATITRSELLQKIDNLDINKIVSITPT
jgi:D-glycero-beta-D-manno-heptose-7-phosphate kinase